MRKITRRIGRADAGPSHKVSVTRDLGDCVVGPGGVPRSCGSNDLQLQTGVSALIERKGVSGPLTNPTAYRSETLMSRALPQPSLP